MSEKIIAIDGMGGKKFSDSTITEALRNHFAEKPYQFQAGDVARNKDVGFLRFIVEGPNGRLQSYTTDGQYMVTDQRMFESNNYEYAGRIDEYIQK